MSTVCLVMYREFLDTKMWDFPDGTGPGPLAKQAELVTAMKELKEKEGSSHEMDLSSIVP